jgi:hypothetical protein
MVTIFRDDINLINVASGLVRGILTKVKINFVCASTCLCQAESSRFF